MIVGEHMPLTLRDAIAHVEPLRQSRLVAGEKGLDNIVQFVNVMEVPDILAWVHPGELLVTTLYPLRDDTAAIEALIPKLAEKGLTGLAVTLGYISQFPQAMIKAADDLGFPLIELPQNVSFIDIIQPLTSKILDLQANELVQSGKIHKQFIDLVLGGGGYPDIAQGLAQLVKRSVSIVDRFRRVLAHGLLFGQTQIQHWFTRDDATGDGYLSGEYRPELINSLPNSAALLMSAKHDEGEIEHVVYTIKVGTMTLGQIIVWGPLLPPLSPIDLIAIEHGSTVTALKMMEERSIREMEQRFRNEILDGLLSGQPAAHERAVYQLREMGYQFSPPFTLVVVAPDLPPGQLLMKAERQEQSNVNSSLHLAMRYMKLIEPKAVFWYQGPRLVVFFPLRAGRLPTAKDFITKELRKVCQRVEVENHPYTVSMGISSAATELSQFKQAYECAGQSLETGRTLKDDLHSAVTHYEDLGIFRVTSLAASPASLERFCHETLGPLLQYDRRHGTDLVKTLRVFLEQNQNSAQAARVLLIHYNTLRYRVDQVRELLGDVLNHPQERLVLEVALQIASLTSLTE